MGPELLRTKDLARLSNSYTEENYNAALKVLKRIYVRRQHGIVITRHAAGKELVPLSVRPTPDCLDVNDSGEIDDSESPMQHDTGSHIIELHNEITKNSLCRGKALFSQAHSSYAVDDAEQLDIPRILLPINPRYCLLAYGDASFAVGNLNKV